MRSLLTSRLFAWLVAAGAAIGAAAAQTYPSRTVTIVVPTPPGGQPDILARLAADRLSRTLPQRFVVENKPGNNSNIAPTQVARAEPDGHTLLVGSAPFTINPSLYTDLAFDAQRDFVPVAMLGAGPAVLVVNPSVPATTLAEFVAYLRRNPGKPLYGSPGAGTASRLLFERFKRLADFDVGIVPYRGAGPVFNDVLAGHVPFTIAQLEVAAAMAKEGRLRALAVSSRQRTALLPDVPTFAELGYPIDVTVWTALFAPKGTPDAVVQLLNAEIRKAMADPEVTAVLAKLGNVAEPLSGAEVGGLLARDIAHYREIVKTAGVTVDQ